MRQFLSYDEASGELRLVFTDLWDGQHERTEFRVVNDDGSGLRRGREFDGLPVYGNGTGGHYVKLGQSGREARLVLAAQHADTVKTPCRRLASKSGRARCALCG